MGSLHRDSIVRDRHRHHIFGCKDSRKSSPPVWGGFSLIELIVVIAIMATLVGLIAPQYVKYVRKKREETCRHNRESILKIYERAVYDGSTTIILDDPSITKVMDVTYKPTASEVEQYLSCPVDDKNRSWHAYISEDGSACIKCDTCDNVVSVDLLGWSGPVATQGVDNKTSPPVYPTPTVAVEDTLTVSFNLLGRGSPKPDDQEVEYGKTATRPEDPKAATYTFEGWYTEPGFVYKYTFTEAVTEDITLYAKWEGMGGSNVFPYANDSTWWDSELIKQYHSGEYVESNTSLNGTYNNMYVTLKLPTGIFTAKSGAQFVFIEATSDAKIYMHQASSPEYYSSIYPNYLVSLTGNKTVIDITGKKDTDRFNSQNPGEYLIPLLTHGDLVEFIDGNTSYLYVYWEGQTSDRVVSIADIRKYEKHPNGLYRVNATPGVVTD